MRSSFWIGFVTSTLFATVGLTATGALAGITRSFSANACVAMAGTAPGVVAERASDGQLVNSDPNGGVLVVGCPVVSDSSPNTGGAPPFGPWSAQGATVAHLYVWSNAASAVSVEACRTYFTGWGGTCVFGASTPASGVQDLQFNPSAAWGPGSPNDGYWLKATVGFSSAIFSYTYER